MAITPAEQLITHITVTGVAQATSQLRVFRNEIATTGGVIRGASAAVDELGAAALPLGIAITGVGIGMGMLAGGTVRAAIQMDNLRRGMTATMGSARLAADEISRLQETAKLPGIGYQEAISGSMQLQAAGLTAERARQTIQAFGNAIAAAGGTREQMQFTMIALRQIAAMQGKGIGQEVRQLMQHVPQIRQAMKDAFGTSNTEELQKMGIGTEEFFDKVNAALRKIPQMTAGPQNAMENMQDSIWRMNVSLGEGLIPVTTAFANTVGKMAEGITTLNKATGGFLGQAIGVSAALITTIGLLTMLKASLRMIRNEWFGVAGAAGAAGTAQAAAATAGTAGGAGMLALPGRSLTGFGRFKQALGSHNAMGTAAGLFGAGMMIYGGRQIEEAGGLQGVKGIGGTALSIGGGALTGASIGSMAGPIGTAIGAALGAALGGWGAYSANKQAQDSLKTDSQRQTEHLAAIKGLLQEQNRFIVGGGSRVQSAVTRGDLQRTAFGVLNSAVI